MPFGYHSALCTHAHDTLVWGLPLPINTAPISICCSPEHLQPYNNYIWLCKCFLFQRLTICCCMVVVLILLTFS